MADKKISELTAYTPAVDVDLVPIVDTTAGITKHITWANIKATLKTYFDSLTTTLTNKTLSTGSKLDANADPNFTYNSLSRQAIINGNFDVWQRGTSFTGSGYWADRWSFIDGGDFTVSRQTTGAPIGSTYVMRIAQTSTSYVNFSQPLESTTVDKLKGKSVTISVKIRRNATFSSLVRLDLEKNATADTLTGGTWSSIEAVNIANASMPTGTTSADWYTATLTATIPADGTANGLRVTFYMGAASPNGGYFEIAQVQLCAGDVALPFMPKSFEEELRACQRYYEKSYDYELTPGTDDFPNQVYCFGIGDNASYADGVYPYKVTKRANPIVVFYNGTTANQCLYRLSGGSTTGTIDNPVSPFRGINQCAVRSAGGTPTGIVIQFNFHFTASAEL